MAVGSVLDGAGTVAGHWVRECAREGVREEPAIREGKGRRRRWAGMFDMEERPTDAEMLRCTLMAEGARVDEVIDLEVEDEVANGDGRKTPSPTLPALLLAVPFWFTISVFGEHRDRYSATPSNDPVETSDARLRKASDAGDMGDVGETTVNDADASRMHGLIHANASATGDPFPDPGDRFVTGMAISVSEAGRRRGVGGIRGDSEGSESRLGSIVGRISGDVGGREGGDLASGNAP